MHRFFVPPQFINGEEARLEGPQAHQLSRVLRARKGDSLVLLDNLGWEYLVELLTISDDRVEARVLERRPAPSEARLSITLYQGTLKGKKFDWVLQKGTEIGVAGFVPLLCERCVALPSEDRSGRRWDCIAREASEQCGRGRMPHLARPIPFRDACRNAPAPSFLLWERAGIPGLKEALRSMEPDPPEEVGLFVGPEGGFSSEEVSHAEQHGLLPISLGRRILRGESAGVVAAALLLYEFGELG